MFLTTALVLVVVFVQVVNAQGDTGAIDRGGNESCILPQWKLPKYTHSGSIIRYNSNCEASVLRCYCLTATENSATHSAAGTGVSFSLGKCIEGCFITDKYTEYGTLALYGSYNGSQCAPYNRRGTLCGECISEHGPAPYSFSLRCIKCPRTGLWSRLFYYLLIAYGPLTLFMVVIVVFTISSNSAPMHGFIFVCQTLSCSFNMRILTRMAELGHIDPYSYKILGTAYGIWNLDFFRPVYEPFCLHESLTTLHVIALDLAIAAYPLVTIFVLYVMHSHDEHRLLIPFHRCCLRFRQQLNIRTYLIDAFGTFFSLSFVKMFSTITDLLAASRVWKDGESKPTLHPYSQGDAVYFGSGHLPFALIGLLLLIVFNLLPIALLLIYSFPRSQWLIQYFPRSVRNALYPLMDNILSCYKDGTNGTHNCRYFAVIYQISRMTIFLIMVWTKGTLSYPLIAFVLSLTILLVALIQPYKSPLYNTLDTFLLVSISATMLGDTAFFIAYADDPQHAKVCVGLIILSALLPLLYAICSIGYKVWTLGKKAKIRMGSVFECKIKNTELSENSPLVTQ